ncbi:amino acid adenylation domain-containing protein [Actinosynnema sp. CS-041913]|uniref:amino acid adenylation domain-containing protein n=1 Tax=Actinosynnema sp. CS-041913 TaxID=3239917 RepID=UPI003D89EA63
MGDRPETQLFPASFAQERLWFVAQLAPDLGVYNIAFPVTLPDGLDVDLFRDAFERLVDRHETLRTALAIVDGRLTQVVHRRVPVEFAVTDASPDEVDALVTADCARPIDPASAPLWRARLIRLPEDRWVLGFVVHHCVFDARSVSNLVGDLTGLYRAAGREDAAELPELEIQYADFAAWQRDQLAGGALDGELAYWRRRLADLPPEIGLPTDRPRPPRPSHRGGEVWLELPAEDHQAVKRLARTAGTTAYAVLLAGFVAVLHRLSGQADVVVACPVAGRQLPELEPLIGMFVNTLVLRVDCGGTPSFRELVRRSTETLRSALDHSEIPFDRLVEELAPDRDAARAPLYQVVLNLIPSIGSPQTGNGTAKVDLILDLAEDADGLLRGRLEYSADLFDESTAHDLADRFTRLMGAALADPDLAVNRLPLLLDGERERLTAQPSTGAVDPETPAPVRFARAASRLPDEVAVCDSAGGRLTYGELRGRANRLTHRLSRFGPGPVAVLFDNTVELAVAVLGVLASGRPYLPLDVEHPAERMRFLLADAGAVAVVATGGRRIDTDLPVLHLDDARDDLPVLHPDDARDDLPVLHPDDARDDLPSVVIRPESLAYLVYTSGSTGEPKAVGVTHGNLAAYLDGVAALLTPPDRPVWASLQPLTYDFAVTAFFGALCGGGTLHLVSRERATDSAWLGEHLRREAVDYLKITPSHLAALDAAELAPRRALILGGEASTVDRLRELRRTVDVVNHYGPTETTVGVLALPADRDAHPIGGLTPLGWPMAHAEAYVLDELGEPVPDGVVGELCIGGATVSRGYLGRPGLTADRFRPDPFSGRSGARLYRTGDRVRRLRGGALEFLGRSDDQVKIRGHRVELGEVRHVLAGHPDVADCAVTASPELAAYLIPVAGRRLDPDALRAHAARALPDFMVPTSLTVLDELPLTPHGKLDRSRLPALPPAPVTPTGDAPSGEFEEVVAGLFGSLLGREHIRRTDDFIAIGGHSLLVIKLITRMRKAFGVTLPLPVVFAEPTVARLAAVVAGKLRTGDLPPITPVPPGEVELASYGEQRLWFTDQLNPGATLHNVQYLRRLTGPLDRDVLERALRGIVRRHEVLRTRFVATPDGLTRVVDAEPGFPFELVDLSGLDPVEREDERRALLDERGGLPFDLATRPPLRVLLIRLASDEHQLLLTVHHAVFDGPSVEVLSAELAELYPALRDGRAARLPELPVRYADFAAWQRAAMSGEAADPQLAYWRRQLAGLPARLDLPTDRPRPPRIGVSGAYLRFDVPADVVDALRAVGAGEGATLFMASLACYVELLRRYSGAHDLAVGVPMITRQRPELEPLIGFFVNTLALRVDAGGAPTFRELLRRVRQVTIEAYSNADVPFEVLVDELAPRRDPSTTPLVQTMFMLADDRRALPVDMGGVRLEFEPFGLGSAKFDVFLYLWRRPDGLTCALEYRPELFDEETMRRFAAHYTDLLAAAAAEPDKPLADTAAELVDD